MKASRPGGYEGENKGGEILAEIKITLAAARVNAGMTQKQAADELHVSNRTLVNWEQGKIVPSYTKMLELSRLYDIPLDNIFVPTESTLSE